MEHLHTMKQHGFAHITLLLFLIVGIAVGLFLVRNSQELRKKAQTAPVYYVDAINGDDTKDGKTPATAFQHLSKIEWIVQPGSTVYLKGTFADQTLRIGISGTATALLP